MPLIFVYDTETTGIPLFDQPSDDPRQPHIVEVAAGLFDQETGARFGEYHAVVRPDGWTIPDEVAAIHGITTERALAEGIPEAEMLGILDGLWSGNDVVVRVAHNEQFDARIARIAYKRFLGEAAADRWKAGKAECTARLSTPILALPPTARMKVAKAFKHKTPTLAEAYRHFFGEDLVGAHGALADMRACARVYFAIKAMGAPKPVEPVSAAMPATIPTSPAGSANDEIPFL